MLDIEKIRAEFPILHQEVNKRPLAYFDNAASSQKPQVVIDAISNYYSTINSNIHRGVHHLSQLATDAYEQSREKIRKHLNAEKKHEIIFTKGTTDSINLVANGFRQLLQEGDEIIVSAMEHHSNIVPWQLAAKEKGAIIRVIPMNDNAELIFEEYQKLLNEKTKIVAFNHISNALGTINPVKEMIAEAHKYNVPVMVDGAQAIPHTLVDVQDLDADFYCFSSHKVYGPTGIGILYGKEEWLEKLPPYQGGGEMIKEVSFEGTTYAELPHKFEAGTPHIEGGIVLGTAIDYINTIGVENIAAHEHALMEYALEKLGTIEGFNLIGSAKNKAAVISFLIDGIHPYDAGTILDKLGIAVRTGHHCAQPTMSRFNIPGTVRASFAVYNTYEEIDRLHEGLLKVKQMFA